MSTRLLQHVLVHLTQTAVVVKGFHGCLSVYPHDVSETEAARIAKLDNERGCKSFVAVVGFAKFTSLSQYHKFLHFTANRLKFDSFYWFVTKTCHYYFL